MSFFRRIRERTEANYTRNNDLVQTSTQVISRSFGKPVMYVAFTAIGNLVDSHYAPFEKFPPFFATLGGMLGVVIQPACLIRTIYIPVNAISSALDAVGEEAVITMK